MGLSKNKGTPKWMGYNGKPLLEWMIWIDLGGATIFGNIHMSPNNLGLGWVIHPRSPGFFNRQADDYMSSKLGKRFVRCLDFGVVVAERKETEGSSQKEFKISRMEGQDIRYFIWLRDIHFFTKGPLLSFIVQFLISYTTSYNQTWVTGWWFQMFLECSPPKKLGKIL